MNNLYQKQVPVGKMLATTIKDKYELPRKHVFFIPGHLQYGY
jgi:hypothetical protein